jgi:rfaE bifunctional protein nucleotidyltransferase chain/domain
MSLFAKIIHVWELAQWRALAPNVNIVATNGCFDILHAGHVIYLEKARALGDILVLGLNGDDSVRQLKGEGRPINGEQDRAIVMAALESVDLVVIFPEVRATRFLELARPDIYAKGGDYTLDTLDKSERAVLDAVEAQIVFIPFVNEKSTTATIQRAKEI